MTKNAMFSYFSLFTFSKSKVKHCCLNVTGAQGDTGFTGNPGAKGFTGNPGYSGNKGPKGAKGRRILGLSRLLCNNR